MILQGNDLFVSVDGQVIGASKSCTLDLDCDAIPVASPTGGNWVHKIAGKCSWRVITNHLLRADLGITAKIEAQASAHNGLGTGVSSITMGTASKTISSIGLNVVPIRRNTETGAYSLGTPVNYDTYNDTQSASASLVSALNFNAWGGTITNRDIAIALISYDAFGMTTALRTAIANYFQVDMSAVETTPDRQALVIIGMTSASQSNPGIKAYSSGNGATAHVKDYMLNETTVYATPVKSFALRNGQRVTLRLQTDGFGYDYLTGTALVKAVKITSTKGNLMQGSLSFEGSGPLT